MNEDFHEQKVVKPHCFNQTNVLSTDVKTPRNEADIRGPATPNSSFGVAGPRMSASLRGVLFD